jgi:hypothetical protein
MRTEHLSKYSIRFLSVNVLRMEKHAVACRITKLMYKAEYVSSQICRDSECKGRCIANGLDDRWNLTELNKRTICPDCGHR